MKKIEDFKIINNTAILEGIAYREEAMIVDEFLKNNQNIQYVSLKTNDNRSFELIKGKLIPSINSTFINPYYNLNISSDNIDHSQKLDEKNINNQQIDVKASIDVKILLSNLKNQILNNNKTIFEQLEKIETLIQDKR